MRGGSARDKCGVDVFVESGEAGLIFDGEGQEVEVGEDLRTGERREPLEVAEAKRIGPELMAWRGDVPDEQLAGEMGSSRSVAVAGVSEDPDKCVLHQRAGGPTRFLSDGKEP